MSGRSLPCLVAALLLAGCAAFAPRDDAAPPLRAHAEGTPSPAAAAPAPKLALVLGGGGVRGFAHLGALAALEEAGLDADLVVGTSVGSVVGALYAAGKSAPELIAIADDLRASELADWSWRGPGFVAGEALERWIDRQVGGRTIESLPRRYLAVATGLRAGTAQVVSGGPVGRAVRASSSLPGVFRPVPLGEDWLVDGGLSRVLPVRVARSARPAAVIAVDVYCAQRYRPPASSAAVLVRSMQIQSCALAEEDRRQADVLVAPALDPASITAFRDRAALIAAGREAARAALRAACAPASTLSATARDAICPSSAQPAGSAGE